MQDKGLVIAMAKRRRLKADRKACEKSGVSVALARVHPDERKFVVRAGKLACSLRELSGSHY